MQGRGLSPSEDSRAMPTGRVIIHAEVMMWMTVPWDSVGTERKRDLSPEAWSNLDTVWEETRKPEKGEPGENGIRKTEGREF